MKSLRLLIVVAALISLSFSAIADELVPDKPPLIDPYVTHEFTTELGSLSYYLGLDDQQRSTARLITASSSWLVVHQARAGDRDTGQYLTYTIPHAALRLILVANAEAENTLVVSTGKRDFPVAIVARLNSYEQRLLDLTREARSLARF